VGLLEVCGHFRNILDWNARQKSAGANDFDRPELEIEQIGEDLRNFLGGREDH
jgi:hypothetical protein